MIIHTLMFLDLLRKNAWKKWPNNIDSQMVVRTKWGWMNPMVVQSVNKITLKKSGCLGKGRILEQHEEFEPCQHAIFFGYMFCPIILKIIFWYANSSNPVAKNPAISSKPGGKETNDTHTKSSGIMMIYRGQNFLFFWDQTMQIYGHFEKIAL